MVPMRGSKFKFEEGEKVLCYEPDPTKARVLYDSKVLEVNVNRDKKGRKAVEYLIHFQGWNSSWDRYVSEDHILKHTEENWKLQKELAEKAQLRPTAYLYRRDHKGPKGNEVSFKRNNKSEHSTGHRTASATTSREGSPDSCSTYDTSLDKDESNRRKRVTDHRKKREKSVMEDEHLGNAYEDDDSDDYGVKHESDSDDSREAHSDDDEVDDHNQCGDGDLACDQDSEDFVDHNNSDNSECTTEDEASGEDAEDISQSEEGAQDTAEENFPLEFTAVMRDILDLDNELIKNTNKLVILPAKPNVVTILESYVREYAINQICGTPDNLRRKYRRRHNHQNGPLDIERINRSINICKEVADGVRIYFDFTLSGLLLYNEEKDQYEQTRNMNIKRETDLGIYAAVDKDGENAKYRQSNVSHLSEPSTSHLDEVSYDNKCVGANSLKRHSRSHCHTDIEAKDFITTGSTSKVDDKESEKPLMRNPDCSANNGSFFVLVVPKKEPLSEEHDKLPSTINSSLKCKTSGSVPSVSSVEDMLRSRGCPPAALKFLSSQVLEWHLVPESMYTEKPSPPSLVYGAVHLARLFVKLPGLLHNTDMQARKLKLVLRHLQLILKYLEQNKSWFGEEFYESSLVQKME
ncbi:male-specific lethal 3 homolog isoform X1 [Schistocerca cancellata]|uniref:male-specific lethal 3 homolog isoform X1 n=1 Tax=Schistocerca cancellata TaxID=274614 RepID=UPI0021191048|nr:male-specific lethal 3 homolog isoform X1 [Schistocerca cancellata]